MYKNFFSLSFILMVLLPCSALSQSKNTDIIYIRKVVSQINSDKNYQLKKLRNEQISNESTDGGSELTGYYKKSCLKKIVVSAGLSYGILQFEFYYSNDSVIFVYEQMDSFVYDEKKQGFRYDTTERTFEGRYYFKKSKLLDYKTTGHNRFEDDQIDTEKTLLSESNKYRGILARKSK